MSQDKNKVGKRREKREGGQLSSPSIFYNGGDTVVIIRIYMIIMILYPIWYFMKIRYYLYLEGNPKPGITREIYIYYTQHYDSSEDAYNAMLSYIILVEALPIIGTVTGLTLIIL